MKRPYSSPSVKRAVKLHYRAEPFEATRWTVLRRGRFDVECEDGSTIQIQPDDMGWLAVALANCRAMVAGRFGFPSGVTLGVGSDDAQAFQVFP